MIRFFFFLLLSSYLTISAQSRFEGTVTFSITKGKEVMTRTVWVKNDSIRVEEFIGNNQKNKSIYLIDGKSKVGFILSPERKLYMKTVPYETTEDIEVSDAIVLEKDSLFGYEVEQWQLSAIDLKRTINFAFSPNDFFFYRDLLFALPDRTFLERLFLQLPLAENVLPLLAEYTDINDQRIYQMKVVEIDVSIPSSKLFRIPKGFTQF